MRYFHGFFNYILSIQVFLSVIIICITIIHIERYETIIVNEGRGGGFEVSYTLQHDKLLNQYCVVDAGREGAERIYYEDCGNNISPEKLMRSIANRVSKNQ